MRRLAFLPPLVLLVGCSGDGNTGQPNRNFSWYQAGNQSSSKPIAGGTQVDLFDQIPWANHATPQLDQDGKVKVSNEPVFPPIASDMPDPGSAPVDCSALQGIELSPYYVDDFEPLGTGAEIGMAPGWSSYDDGSDGSFRTPGDVDWYPGLAGRYGLNTFGLASDRQVGERPLCLLDQNGQPKPNDWALHYRGGRFNYYGGGMAHAFRAERYNDTAGKASTECPAGADFCPESDAYFDQFHPDGPYQQLHVFVDASAYDGVAFWARRGPEGATGLLIGLQDRHTSDDLARENEKFCKRLKVCVPNCVNGFECIQNPDGAGEELGLYRCMPPGMNVEKVTNPALREFLFPRCGQSTCVSPNFYKDLDFDGTECKPYAFTGNDEGYWCHSDDKPVAPWAERCGDGFVAPISLSTDWKLYKLPFDSFKQVGFGKIAPELDLKTLYSIAFQFTVGFTDVYVDNLSFYRVKKR